MLNSRMTRIQERNSSKKLFVSVVLAVAVFVGVLTWGVPLLVNMSAFLSSFNQAKEAPPPKENGIIFAPILDATFEATNSMPIKIKGYANTGGKIELYLNGDLFDTTLASKDGSFVFDQVILNSGPNKLWAKINAGDRKSDNSSDLVILYSKEKPKLELTSPEDDSTVSSDKKEVVVAGTTDEGNSVTVNDHFVIVDQDGKFNYTLPLNDGDNQIKIISTNQAGNQAIVERKVKYSPPN